MAALIRAPVRITLFHEENSSDEGESYFLSYPQMEIPGLPVKVTFFDQDGGRSILGNLAVDDARILPAVMNLLVGAPPGLAQKPAAEIEQLAPPEIVEKLARMAKAAWYLTLQGQDNCDVQDDPAVVVHPLFKAPGLFPTMTAP